MSPDRVFPVDISRTKPAGGGITTAIRAHDRSAVSARPPGDAETERFDPTIPLVEAKLSVPLQRPAMIARRRILERLDAAAAQRVISIVAPAGYGKTTVLSEWVAHLDRPVAWLTVDDLDDTPHIFLTYLAAALDRINPIDGSIGRSLAASDQRLLATAVPRLASELHRWPRPGLIVFDDAHRLTERTSLDALAELIARLPPGAQVALAARSEPDLPLARLRAQRDLLELGREDLALDPSEASELAAAAGILTDPDTIDALTDRSEGWPAGIYLALLGDQLGTTHRGSSVAADVSARDGFIADYLASEMRRELMDPADLTVLTRTSIVEIVDPDLARALADRPDATQRLETLARSNLFIEPTLPAGSYRYHNLLRDFLQGELERREPQLVPLLHHRASEWLRSRGRLDAAVDHLIRSGDLDGAASLVAGVALPMFYGGHVGTIDRWLEAFGPATLERHPGLAVFAGWIHMLMGRAAEADRAADIVDRSTLRGPAGDGAASFESSRAMLRAVMGRHGMAQVLEDAAVAVAAEPPASPWRTNALWLLGSALALTGDAAEGERALSQAIEASGAAGATAMVALSMRANMAMDRGEWSSADDDVDRARKILDEARFGEIVAALIVHAAAARAALHRGQRERARAELVRAQLVRPVASTAAPWFSVRALLDLARAYLADSDVGGARTSLRDAEGIARWKPDLGPVLREDLSTMRERIGDASRVLAGSSSLTTAELRLLPVLSTYLSFQEIADRLVISRNTVKTQAISIYGKLQASSRSEAVERAVELGLLEPFPGFQLTVPLARPRERRGDDPRVR